MLAMHYQFELPADYDMWIIRDRIAARGGIFESMEGLVFKQFLMADFRSDSPTNLYAPVYLWSSPAAALHFLRGPLFAALCATFWKPRVQIGLATGIPSRKTVQSATIVQRSVQMVPGTVTASIEDSAESAADQSLVWLDPKGWTQTLMQFGQGEPEIGAGQPLEIVHLARGADWGAIG